MSRKHPYEKHFNADIEEVVDSRTITYEQLAENFHLPIHEVSEREWNTIILKTNSIIIQNFPSPRSNIHFSLPIIHNHDDYFI